VGAAADTTTTLGPGDVICQKYRIVSVLGQGQTAYILEAINTRLDERVALKFLRREAQENPEIVARFAREAHASAKLRSEHVVRVVDVEKLEDGTPFIVMEFLVGTNLGDHIAKHGNLSLEEAADFLIQACEGLGEVHAAGIVHRDVKPENLFVVEDDAGWRTLKLLDFGISKARTNEPSAIKTQGLVGSPCYMSPEQLRAGSGDVDLRTDIWALGSVFFEMLTGRTPFDHETRSLVELIVTVLEEQPRSVSAFRPDLPPDVVAIIDRCLSKQASQRYASTGALAVALAPFAPKRARAVVEKTVARARAAGDSTVQLASSVPPPKQDAAPISPKKVETLGGGVHVPVRKPTPSPRSLVLAAIACAVGIAGTAFFGLRHSSPTGTAEATNVLPSSPSPAPEQPARVQHAPADAPSSESRSRVVLSITSPVREATVLFRGNRHPLPFSEEVDRMTEREAVEVTAPGRRGKRFWVTLDMSRSFDIELPFGFGLSDGVEKPAPVAAAVPHPVKALPTTVATIGNDPADPPHEQRPPASLASSAPPAAAAAPVTVSPLQAPNATASAPAAPAQVAAGTVSTTSVNATVRMHSAEIRECYQRARMSRSDLRGSVTVRAEVGPAGSVTAARIASSTVGDSRLESCIISSFGQWRFEPPAGGVAGSVTYTFKFE
jgi:serine/threonine-protein kinase